MPRTMDLAYMCVKLQMRLYVCQALPLPNTKCVYMCVTNAFMCVSPNAFFFFVFHQMRLYVFHKMRLLNLQRSSLRSLTFARFARTFLTV